MTYHDCNEGSIAVAICTFVGENNLATLKTFNDS